MKAGLPYCRSTMVERISEWICKTNTGGSSVVSNLWKRVSNTQQAIYPFILFNIRHMHHTVLLYNPPHRPGLPTLLWAHTLGIKETSHPEYIGPAFKYPSRKLSISFQKFGKPEAQCGWVPGHFFSRSEGCEHHTCCPRRLSSSKKDKVEIWEEEKSTKEGNDDWDNNSSPHS